MNQLLIQGICKPLDVIDQVLVLYAGTRGFLDKVPVKEILRWQDEFLEFVHAKKQALWDKINEARKLNDDLNAEIESAINEFGATFK